MLTAYLASTNRLLQNPVPANPLYSTSDLTAYINAARAQLAGEAECIRATSFGSLSFAQQSYNFSLFTVFSAGATASLSGVSGILTIRQMSVRVTGNLQYMNNRAWPWFYRYSLAASGSPTITAGVPTTWAQLGRGTLGTFAVGPNPDNSYTVNADVVCLPIDLADDTTPEAIPVPWREAVPYYAAYMAYMSSQRTQDATTMFERYMSFVHRGTQESTPTVLPINHPGGGGAAGAASRSLLTAPPPQGQR